MKLQSTLVLVAILASIFVSLCHSANNEAFSDYKIENLGETGILSCNDSESLQSVAIPLFYEPVAWMLPNLDWIYNNDTKYGLTDGNWTFLINDTTIEDLGVYHCILQSPNDSVNYYLVKVGLNAEGPYFFDMWDKYMWPTIIAICCFFGFLILAGVFVLLYMYRYIPPPKEKRNSDSSSSDSSSSGVGYEKSSKQPLSDLSSNEHKFNEAKNGSVIQNHSYDNSAYRHDEVSSEHQHKMAEVHKEHKGDEDLKHRSSGVDHYEQLGESGHEYSDIAKHQEKTVDHDSSDDDDATAF